MHSSFNHNLLGRSRPQWCGKLWADREDKRKPGQRTKCVSRKLAVYANDMTIHNGVTFSVPSSTAGPNPGWPRRPTSLPSRLRRRRLVSTIDVECRFYQGDRGSTRDCTGHAIRREISSMPATGASALPLYFSIHAKQMSGESMSKDLWEVARRAIQRQQAQAPSASPRST